MDTQENYFQKALLLHQKGDLQNAKECYKKDIQTNGTRAASYGNLAVIYSIEKKFDEAEKYYIKALDINPNYMDAYSNLGTLYTKTGELQKAQEYFEKAISINPKHAGAYNSLGILYKTKNFFEKSKKCYEKALSIRPDYVDVYSNLGNLYVSKNQLDKAKEYYLKALSIKQDLIDAHFYISLIELLKKNYKNGFDNYRYRYHPMRNDSNTTIFHRDTILDKKTNISNKILLITQEQGFGDNIQFVRFLPNFLEMGAEVIYSVSKPLLRLFQYNYPDIKFVTGRQEVVCHYNFPIMDSAYLLNLTYSTIPHRDGYLKVDPKDSLKIKEKFDFKDNVFKIGINYQGSKGHKNDKNRSIALPRLLEHLKGVKNAKIYAMQYEITPQEEEILKQNNITILKHHIEDFYDTALFIDNMDLIISIDTSLVHLAGAMGKEVFLMLPFAPDWRWGLEDSCTNWYNSLTLFRQKNVGGWSKVLEEISWALTNTNTNACY